VAIEEERKWTGVAIAEIHDPCGRPQDGQGLRQADVAGDAGGVEGVEAGEGLNDAVRPVLHDGRERGS
jgi:hypothetical protein